MNNKLYSFLFATILIITSCNSQDTELALKPADFNKKIKTTTNGVILDVRTADEYKGGFIASALNIDYNGDNFKDEIDKLDKINTYFVYCLSGKRSASAADYMRSNGFKSVYNLEGGILSWQNNNLLLVAIPNQPSADKISFEEYANMINSDSTVLVDYFAPWCAPCIKMKPMLDEISSEYAGKVKVIRLDINENKQLAKKLKIIEIPIIKIFSKGKEIWTHQGYIEKKELIKQL